MQFSHLHCHTQFSLLDGAAAIPNMIAKAKADNQAAVAITDHGNMFGVFKFVAEAQKQGIKPVVGCEFYVVEDRHAKKFTKEKRDKRYHQLLLAKNEIGYQNISKLCSLGYIEGLYSKWPRVDKELIKQYSEGLIATTCCIGAEVPQAIINKGEEEGEKVFREWLEIFGDDYFIELQRHNIQNIDGSGLSQEDVNQILIKWSKKYNVPVIATNDSHYVEEEDANAHDILLCVNTGELQATPIGKGDKYKAKGTRFGFPNDEFYFKTTAQMEQLFHDIPQALDNTNIIVDRINTPSLSRDVLLPNFVMPSQFQTQDDYLRYLTFEGAKKRYGEIEAHVEERLNFELEVIKKSGYPGYFLIVQDFTTEARNLGVSVGPGRGSAAGSAVAYCIGITNVDPIKYDLLFERFLNPERVSMPDIDIDFDDEGRQQVIDYVVDKYGKNQVSQIITYGSMAAKSSLRDVGRVLDVPLADVGQICKQFPDHLSASLGKVLKDGGLDEKLKGKMNADQINAAEAFRKLADGKDNVARMIKEAKKLEGSIRNTGVHACGVIITPDDITKYLPMT
ncbi:MAG: DNA polymerase III subunit alpha, partial [Chitinophagales bacterium]